MAEPFNLRRQLYCKSVSRKDATIPVILVFALFLLVTTPITGISASTSSKSSEAKEKRPPLSSQGETFAWEGQKSINLRIVGDNFRLYFIDETRRPLDTLPLEKATVRIDSGNNDKTHVLLTPSSDETGPFLTSVKFIRKPYKFRVFMAIYGPNEENAVFSRSFFFSQ